jgi:glycerol-3-phosphate acyltransferase PlsY
MKLIWKKSSFILIITSIWLLITILTKKGDLAADSVFEIGFPLVFYRQCNGKYEKGINDLGFDYPNLFLDILCLFIVIFLFIYLKRKVNCK